MATKGDESLRHREDALGSLLVDRVDQLDVRLVDRLTLKRPLGSEVIAAWKPGLGHDGELLDLFDA